MKARLSLLFLFSSLFLFVQAQVNWPAIKANSSFIIHDTAYSTAEIQPINLGGWEDGLYITRDGKNLYSTFLPIDLFSWLGDLAPCIDFRPYFRPPLLGIDTLTNPFNCPNYMHSDIISSSRQDTSQAFSPWSASNLKTSASFEGGACGILLNADTFDTFVYTQDIGAPFGVELFLTQNVSINPSTANAVQILSSPGQEDNPHIERLNDTTLLLLFDRDRYMYYSTSFNNGVTWQNPTLISHVLNDQAPYDVQPHLWHDGQDWWVFFGADNSNGVRCIYKSKQQIIGDWDSWAPKELVLEPNINIAGGVGTIFGIGEPSLTAWGDLSFVVVYGDLNSPDSTDVFDCDPWILRRKNPIVNKMPESKIENIGLSIFPNPASNQLFLSSKKSSILEIQIFNLKGSIIEEIQFQNSQIINVKDWPRGLYFIRSKNKPTETMKFLLN